MYITYQSCFIDKKKYIKTYKKLQTIYYETVKIYKPTIFSFISGGKLAS